MSNQLILILDFGGQYNQLIARRVRECSVYCEVRPYTLSAAEIRALSPIGIILTGGPSGVQSTGAPLPDPDIWKLGIPILGICYGMQVMAHQLGGTVKAAGGAREFGRTQTIYNQDCKLFYGLPSSGEAWMSHGDFVSKLPDGFVSSAYTDTCPNAAMSDPARKLYGLQFHPEVAHTASGGAMLKNFLQGVCGAMGDWSMGDFSRAQIQRIRAQVGQGRVLLALSGGVDSSVTAAILERAIGERLTCIFVNTGLMRKNEPQEVEAAFGGGSLNFIHVNAEARFLSRLSGVCDPETKRKIIGEEFIRVFEEEAAKIGAVDFLAQGTIYPDIIESGLGDAAVIKSHHNVGGLPDHVDFKDIIEPLALLFKDEVRQLGKELGLSPELVERQPFPGPGIAIRIIGEVTKERADLLREADYIFRDEISRAGLRGRIDQYFAVLTDMKSVGVMGDARTYECAIALRAVTTSDFMTAAAARIPFEVLERATSRIIAEVHGVNRVVYDVTSKPPATIEWE